MKISTNVEDTLWYINIDPGIHRGWKTIPFHYKLLIFRVYVIYVNLPEGSRSSTYSNLFGKILITDKQNEILGYHLLRQKRIDGQRHH